MKYLWMKVSMDKYELPLIVCDSAAELARRIGVPTVNIRSAISKAKKRGHRCRYVRVVIDEED